jgi:perosamine synthetase
MINLAKPIISETIIEKVAAVLRSGNLVQGQHVRLFEQALQDYLCVEHAVVVSSGTAALHLALMALHIQNGDEVIVPAFTFPATANVVENVGGRPVLIDISLSDYCLDPARIEGAITKKTRAIIVVHEFGQAADMEKIVQLARKHNLYLIEDAACALGTRFNNRPVGTFGSVGCFSFHPRKIITTGEGGAVVTGVKGLAEKIHALRNHGLTSSGASDFSYAGLNYRMTDFQAVMGYYQLSGLEDDIQKRIRLAQKYGENLSVFKWLKLPETLESRRHIYQTFHIVLEDDLDRGQFISLLKNYGIEANFGAQALHLLPFYKNKYAYAASDFPQASLAFHHGLALPMGTHVTEEDIDFIADTMKLIYDELVKSQK